MIRGTGSFITPVVGETRIEARVVCVGNLAKQRRGHFALVVVTSPCGATPCSKYGLSGAVGKVRGDDRTWASQQIGLSPSQHGGVARRHSPGLLRSQGQTWEGSFRMARDREPSTTSAAGRLRGKKRVPRAVVVVESPTIPF